MNWTWLSWLHPAAPRAEHNASTPSFSGGGYDQNKYGAEVTWTGKARHKKNEETSNVWKMGYKTANDTQWFGHMYFSLTRFDQKVKISSELS